MANIFDARDYKVPNELILLGYVAGLLLNIQTFLWSGLFLFIVKATLPILILYLLYQIRALGAGDIKLFSIISVIVGFEFSTDVMIASVMLAGVAVLVLFLYERKIELKRKLHYSFYITAAFFLLQLTN